MIKILAIGNSFSQDATAYLYDIAKADSTELKVVNLCIGGCSLETHCENIENNLQRYEYELNGQNSNRIVSIYDTLIEDDWDFVTLQQVSQLSGVVESFYPYITKLSAYVKQYAPSATQILHQTWAYEIDSSHGGFALYDNNQAQMHESLVNAYNHIARDLSLSIIPCGNVIHKLRSNKLFDYSNGGISLCRDGFHMNLIYGRYAVAATWYEFFTGKTIFDNNFVPPTEDGTSIDMNNIKIIKKCVHECVIGG